MMYVPMLKIRAEELRVAKEMNTCFSDKIVPLFEIINEIYKTTYKTDKNGEYILEQRKSRNCRVKAKPTEEDIITLQHISNIADGKLIFMDYFRFSLRKYGKNISFRKAELSFDLNNDLKLYKKKLLDTTIYNNMIPVISLKPDCDFPKSDLIKFVAELQAKTIHIALRITEEWIDQTKDIVQSLRETDFLLFDVEEQNPELKFMEIQELVDLQSNCQKVLLNSPRKLAIKNGEYPEYDQTDLINNCARVVAEDNGFDGYGDYCGLKDAMPTNDGSNGTGAALALLYDYKQNVFYSFCNHDTSLGMSGYSTLIPVIKADEPLLNPNSDCPGYTKIHSLPSTGSWSTWHHINAARYIYQTYKNI
ncbi:MAG: hypothetical protein ACERKZ_00725 [Lachnotalea sp.]